MLKTIDSAAPHDAPQEPGARPLYLVTGAAGFVGLHLTRHLAANGYRVRAMVRRPEQAGALRDLVEDVVVADLTRPDTLAAAVEGVAGVYNIAGLFRQADVPDRAYHDINVEGVRTLLEASVAAGVGRFVHCSTNGVHGVHEHPADETAPFDPSDLYQQSKLDGERVVQGYFDDGRMRGVIIRPTMIYGPGDQRTLKLFSMVANGRFFYVGRGEALTHWVDVRDLARAFELAMQAEEISGEAFPIGGRDYHSLRQNVAAIARHLGVKEPKLHLPVAPVMALAHATEIVCRTIRVPPPLYRRRVAFFLKDRAFDISKARRLLGYEPKTDYAGEIVDIIEAYRQSGDLPSASGTTP